MSVPSRNPVDGLENCLASRKVTEIILGRRELRSNLESADNEMECHYTTQHGRDGTGKGAWCAVSTNRAAIHGQLWHARSAFWFFKSSDGAQLRHSGWCRIWPQLHNFVGIVPSKTPLFFKTRSMSRGASHSMMGTKMEVFSVKQTEREPTAPDSSLAKNLDRAEGTRRELGSSCMLQRGAFMLGQSASRST